MPDATTFSAIELSVRGIEQNTQIMVFVAIVVLSLTILSFVRRAK